MVLLPGGNNENVKMGYIMDNQQPGVSVIQQTLSIQKPAIQSAVPLFIGYTETQPDGRLAAVSTFADYEFLFGTAHAGNSVLYYTVRHFFDNGGMGGFVYSLGAYEELDQAEPADIITALTLPALSQAIAAEQSITLLAFPDIVLLPETESMTEWQQGWQTLLTLSQCRPGLFGILDSPDEPLSAECCLAGFTGVGREWGGAYWPRLVTPYRKAGEVVVVPPSGAVMAAIQQADYERGVWSAPANVALSQVVNPSHSYLEASGLFNPQGASFNLIRSFPGRGTRIWGCRTLTDSDLSPFQYIQARRLLSYCELCLSALGNKFLFDPNNDITWYKLKGMACNWLRQLWLQGGLLGAQEDDAFQVLLGLDETMTQEDILSGRMIMNIRLSMLSPAEFIELSLTFAMGADGNA